MDMNNPLNPLESARLTVRIPMAANMLGIGRSKLYELISAGEVEVIKIGKATLIVVESLQRFVERRRAA
jgi:excisionase family DNA binding protein